MRRHALEDRALLGVRLLILTAATLALAGPLIVTRYREAAWNAQTQTAVVSDADVRSGLRRAVAALEDRAPGRREVVVRSAFPIGSITQADVAAVPSHVGLRFERTGALPPLQTVDLPAVLTETGTRTRTMTVDRSTTVREGAAASGVVSQHDVDAVTEAVLSQHVLAPVDLGSASPSEGRRVRIVAAGSPEASRILPIRQAWMADAVAFVAQETGRPLVASGALDGTLTLVSDAAPGSLASALLLRAAMNAVGDRRVPAAAETIAIDDAQLRAWTRAPGPAPPPRYETLDHDDRRWFWIVALALLGVESWLRSREPSKREAFFGAEAPGAKAAGERESSRVA